MKTKTTTLAAIVLAFGLQTGYASMARAAGTEPLQSIPSLDVPRYLGTWHEIAKYPNRFQKKCASDTRAIYSLRDEGRIEVVNQCRRQDGSLMEAVGVARQVGPPDSAQLKVRFAPAWLSFLPVAWGNYWVIDLDPEYQLVAVSEPKREYLWVLSRTPEVDEEAYRQLLARLEAQGFDLDRLERSPHDMGEGASR
jgi:apolipoprotein D and lipocalin family protein